MHQEIELIGNLGRDPELRYMPDGAAVTSMSVATNRRWTNQTGETQEQTTWFRVSVWGKQAETVNQYLSRGQRVFVKGTLQSDPQTGGPKLFTRQDGSVGASFEVRALTVRFLTPKGQGDSGYASDGGEPAAFEEDQIPF